MEPVLCHCGQLAVGRCSECGCWCCSRHGRIAYERFYCQEHARQAEDRVGEAARERTELVIAQVQTAIREFLAQMAAAGNPGKDKYERQEVKPWRTRPKGRIADYRKLWTRTRTGPGWFLIRYTGKEHEGIFLTTDGRLWRTPRSWNDPGEYLDDDGTDMYLASLGVEGINRWIDEKRRQTGVRAPP